MAGPEQESKATLSDPGRAALTLAGVALPDQPNHQGGAVAALGGAGEGLDAELVSFRLQRTARQHVRHPERADACKQSHLEKWTVLSLLSGEREAG